MVRIDLEVIDCGEVIAKPFITDDNWDGALFDFEEAQKKLSPGQWLHIPNYWDIPDPHRIRFC